MPAATTKAELLGVTLKDYAKLETLLDELTEDQAAHMSGDGIDAHSIKGLIAHRTHWIELFFGWFDAGQRGETVHVPDKGVKWNQLKPYNAEIRARAASRAWADVLHAFKAAHLRLVAFIEAQDDATLYGESRWDWTGKWTLGRYAEASGASHYRSALKAARSVLREQTG